MRETSGETRASMVGLDFWPFAHSEVIRKISMRSISAADAVMVPNSLGPGELLMRFGDERAAAILAAPSWSGDPKGAPKPINAMTETDRYCATANCFHTVC